MAKSITAYRVGDSLTLPPPFRETGTVTVALADDVEVRTAGTGRQLLCRASCAYGVTVAHALALGWCWLVEG